MPRRDHPSSLVDEDPKGVDRWGNARQLSAKQIGFCDAYARGLNKAESARLAGYGGNLNTAATRMLRNPVVRELIKHKRQIYASVALVTAGDIVDGLWHEAISPENHGFERIKAYELLGRALGMFGIQGQPVNIAGPPVQIYIPENNRPVVDLRALPDKAGTA